MLISCNKLPYVENPMIYRNRCRLKIPLFTFWGFMKKNNSIEMQNKAHRKVIRADCDKPRKLFFYKRLLEFKLSGSWLIVF